MGANQWSDKTLHQRFWQQTRVSKGCWVWLGPLSKRGKGYGQIKENYVTRGAHRVSWEIHFGSIPMKMYVCHTCDNPACVNPAHLWLGTALDNARDCRDKGRRNNVKGTGVYSRIKQANERGRV